MSCKYWLIAAVCSISAAGNASAQHDYVVFVATGLDDADDAAAWLAVGEALATHRDANAMILLERDELSKSLGAIKPREEHGEPPRYVAFVVPPDWIDDNFVGSVFESLTKLDDNPLLDCAYGYITGRTAADAMKLVERTIAAEKNRDDMPKKFVGIGHTFAAADLGPFATQQAAIHDAYGYETASIIGVDASDEWQAAKAEAVKKLNGASLVFAAGHGMGNWFCAIEGELLRNLTLESAIVVNGTCHSATTLLRHDISPETFGIVESPIDAEESIALNFISAGAIAQIGSTASSSWMNVALAIDDFFFGGRSMGESLMTRLNHAIGETNVERVTVVRFVEGKPSPQFLGSPANTGHIQSYARVILLGDPAYTPFPQGRDRVAVQLPAPQPRAQAQKPAPPPGMRAEVPIEQIIKQLNDPNLPRFQALNDLIARGGPAVEPLIEAMRTNPDWQIPKALGAIGDARAIDPLIAQLDARPGPPSSDVIIEALQLITSAQAGTTAEAWRAWRDAK